MRGSSDSDQPCPPSHPQLGVGGKQGHLHLTSPLGTDMWVPLTVRPWEQPKAQHLGEGFQVKEAELEGRCPGNSPQPAGDEAGGCREWAGMEEGCSLAGITPTPHEKCPTSYRSPKGTGEVWGGWWGDTPLPLCTHTQLVGLAQAGHREGAQINVLNEAKRVCGTEDRA